MKRYEHGNGGGKKEREKDIREWERKRQGG